MCCLGNKLLYVIGLLSSPHWVAICSHSAVIPAKRIFTGLLSRGPHVLEGHVTLFAFFPLTRERGGDGVGVSCLTLYSERPQGAGFRLVNPAERWYEHTAMALALAGFLQHPSAWFTYLNPARGAFYIDIQIKICAEYRDMLPRPRLVCQEPGLRPKSRSPGVPDKSSLGLGSMSRYSAQILICFIACIFQFLLIPLWVWLGTFQDCQYAQCPLPLSFVIRMRLVTRQSKLPAWIVEVQLAHQNTLWHLCHRLVKMTDKMDEICINGKFSVQEPSEWRVFCIPVSNFTVFQPRI